MGFVAALLIAIAMTVIQIGNIYNRGLTLKEVNQAGRSIAGELQRSIAASNPFKFNADQGAGSQYLKDKVGINELKRYIPLDWGGRLCVGQYSYIWNYGKAIQAGDTSKLNVYSDSDNTIRFIKVLDPTSTYCTETNKKIEPTAQPIELLDSSQHDLAIHYFKITTTADDLTTPLINEDTAFDSNTGQRLYSIEFLIGTNDWGTLPDGSGSDSTLTGSLDTTACKPPSELGADPSYCSVSQFDIVARAGNASK
jgi:hypothetical protein